MGNKQVYQKKLIYGSKNESLYKIHDEQLK